MRTLIDTVRGHLEELGLHLDSAPEAPVLAAQLSLTHLTAALRVVQDTSAESDPLMFVMVLPIRVPENRRAAMAETLLRINYQLRLGTFEMDFDDGELRFRVALVLGEHVPDREEVGRWLLLVSAMVDGFFPVFAAVMYGTLSPRQAVEQGEAHVAALMRQRESAEREADDDDAEG